MKIVYLDMSKVMEHLVALTEDPRDIDELIEEAVLASVDDPDFTVDQGLINLVGHLAYELTSEALIVH